MLRVTQLFGFGTKATQRQFAASVTLVGADSVNSRSGYTLLTKIPISAIARGGAYCRLILQAPGVDVVLNNVTIGAVATSGNAWNCAATPTNVTRNGLTPWTLSGPLGTEFASDPITLAITGATALIVGINMGAYANATKRLTALTGTGVDVVSYEKAAVQEAANASRGASYTAQAKQSYFLSRIEVAS